MLNGIFGLFTGTRDYFLSIFDATMFLTSFKTELSLTKYPGLEGSLEVKS